MDNRDRLELRRQRMASAPPLLRGGFRPFFLGAALWAAIAIATWVWSMEAGAMRIAALDPLAWHRHEMIFGFVGAAIAGFALTAVPNWTGRLPIAGWPLALLAGWWLAARLVPFAMPGMPLLSLAAIDGGFYIGLALLILREILVARNRNIPVALAVALFGMANLLDYAGLAGFVASGMGAYAGITLAVTLVSLIGGRIVPSFTRNWLQKGQIGGRLPTGPDGFDLAVILATAAALTAWTLAGTTSAVGAALIVAGILQAVRLARWRGWSTLASPIVLALHLGYAWIPLGLLLLGGASFSAALPQSAGVHALVVGALAGMILAVMTRATLGHTGRVLHAGPATIAGYLTLHLAAIARVFASLTPENYRSLLHLSAALWIVAFGLFVLAYTPLLLRPRADD